MSDETVNDGLVSEAQAPLEELLAGLEHGRAAIGRSVVGQEDVVDQLFLGLMCSGHVLLEGAPGLGKTLLVTTIAAACGLQLSRIQFTPDLMPADITGTIVLVHDDRGVAHSRFQPGPIFAQMVLADEINRATPKTQSALLEAMQERTVTVAGKPHPMARPFCVLATQNPIEMEGTYLLPEAQIDRFLLKVTVPYPSVEVLDTILDVTTGVEPTPPQAALGPAAILRLQELTRSVPVASHVRRAVASFALATQPVNEKAQKEVRRFVRFGISPRGAQALILAAKAHALLAGRYNVAFADLQAVLLPALRHRFQLNFEGEAEGVSAERLLADVFEASVSHARK